jgi:hypothetical protein
VFNHEYRTLPLELVRSSTNKKPRRYIMTPYGGVGLRSGPRGRIPCQRLCSVPHHAAPSVDPDPIDPDVPRGARNAGTTCGSLQAQVQAQAHAQGCAEAVHRWVHPMGSDGKAEQIGAELGWTTCTTRFTWRPGTNCGMRIAF